MLNPEDKLEDFKAARPYIRSLIAGTVYVFQARNVGMDLDACYSVADAILLRLQADVEAGAAEK